jgi:hypothetical protein
MALKANNGRDRELNEMGRHAQPFVARASPLAVFSLDYNYREAAHTFRVPLAVH